MAIELTDTKGRIIPLAETWLSRCKTALDWYVATYNEQQESLLMLGAVKPLGNEFKADRYKSMTGKELHAAPEKDETQSASVS